MNLTFGLALLALIMLGFLLGVTHIEKQIKRDAQAETHKEK